MSSVLSTIEILVKLLSLQYFRGLKNELYIYPITVPHSTHFNGVYC